MVLKKGLGEIFWNNSQELSKASGVQYTSRGFGLFLEYKGRDGSR